MRSTSGKNATSWESSENGLIIFLADWSIVQGVSGRSELPTIEIREQTFGKFFWTGAVFVIHKIVLVDGFETRQRLVQQLNALTGSRPITFWHGHRIMPPLSGSDIYGENTSWKGKPHTVFIRA